VLPVSQFAGTPAPHATRAAGHAGVGRALNAQIHSAISGGVGVKYLSLRDFVKMGKILPGPRP
jgi:hypothetical protein